jgi:hydrogenase expression/formation protein HypC
MAMCLGIPGEVVELVEDNDQLVLVDVLGVQRHINLGMLEEPDLRTGDWILIHMGFAMDKISKNAATEALAGLELMGQALPDEPSPDWRPDGAEQLPRDTAKSA